MPSWRTFFKGKYLSAPLLEADCTFVISEVRGDLVQNPDNPKQKEQKLVIYWKGDVLPWIPCKTTCMCLEAMYGEDIKGWAGKPVTLFNDLNVSSFGQKGGIRVRGAPGIKKKKIRVALTGKKPFNIELFDTGAKR